MAKHTDRAPTHSGVFVSMFVTNRIIERVGKHVTQFDLEGAGYGYWAVDEPGKSIQLMGDLFVVLAFVRVDAGEYLLRFEIELEDGEKLRVAEQPVQAKGTTTHQLQFNVSMTGMTLPIGFHHLWAYVNGEVRACVPIWIYGPESG